MSRADELQRLKSATATRFYCGVCGARDEKDRRHRRHAKPLACTVCSSPSVAETRFGARCEKHLPAPAEVQP